MKGKQLNQRHYHFLDRIAKGQFVDDVLDQMGLHRLTLGRWILNPTFRCALNEALIAAAILDPIRNRQTAPVNALLEAPDLSVPDMPTRTRQFTRPRDEEDEQAETPTDPEKQQQLQELARLYALQEEQHSQQLQDAEKNAPPKRAR